MSYHYFRRHSKKLFAYCAQIRKANDESEWLSGVCCSFPLTIIIIKEYLSQLT